MIEIKSNITSALEYSGSKYQSLDYLGIGAHPDDCEMLCSGLLLSVKKQNFKTGICDLTSGEAGSYGSREKRQTELKQASKLMHLDARITLNFPDGNLQNTESVRLKVVEIIRKYKPKIVLTFGGSFIRHPDHQQAKSIVEEACFLAGLKNLNSNTNADTLNHLARYEPHRPQAIIQFHDFFSPERPDFIVDISSLWQEKVRIIEAYQSQVTPYKQISNKQQTDKSKTFIHSRAFWQMVESKAQWLGSLAGFEYAEGFVTKNVIALNNPLENLTRKLR